MSVQPDQAPLALRDLYEALASHLAATGDGVTETVTDVHVAFRRIRNFACVALRNRIGKIPVVAKIDPDSVTIEPGFTRDVRHFGTADFEITIASQADDRARPLLDRACHES